MPGVWLLIDCNYMAYRSFYTTGALKLGADTTGTIYGFLQSIRTLQSDFNTDKIIFCWDYGQPIRSRLHPGYKAGRATRRNKQSEIERQALVAYEEQVDGLRSTHLTDIGYRNVWMQAGYEADDLIAHALERIPAGDEAVIVSADADLYQLIGPGRVCYNPTQKRITDERAFAIDWGIGPGVWAAVKAIAGCASDDIPGAPGIGEKTAAQWLRGQLKPGKKLDAIREHYERSIANLSLVKLPYPGCGVFNVVPDAVTPASWDAVAARFGMRRLRGRMPRPKDKGFGLG